MLSSPGCNSESQWHDFGAACAAFWTGTACAMHPYHGVVEPSITE